MKEGIIAFFRLKILVFNKFCVILYPIKLCVSHKHENEIRLHIATNALCLSGQSR